MGIIRILCLIAFLSMIFSCPGSADSQSQENNLISPEDTLRLSDTLNYTPFVINTPGVYYLDQVPDRNGSLGIIISSDNVIVEGCRMELTGPGTGGEGGVGIEVGDPDMDRLVSNITIRNITISGFGQGIRLNMVSAVAIEDTVIRENQASGIFLSSSSLCSISKTQISSTRPLSKTSGGAGIVVENSDTIVLSENQILSNGIGDNGDGIRLQESSGVSISGCIISGNSGSGIKGSHLPAGLVIRESVLESNGGNGIFLENCDGPVLAENRMSENKLSSLDIISSRDGILTGNRATDGRVGLCLSESERFRLKSNSFRSHSINIDISGSSPAMFSHTIDTSNTADGRPILYIRDMKDVKIGSSDNPACIYLVNCSEISVSDLILHKNGAGIWMINSEKVTISHIATLDNAVGIRIGFGSSDIRIVSSSAENNLIAGFAVSQSDAIRFENCSAQKNLAGYLITGSTDVSCIGCTAEKQQGLKKRGPSGFQIAGSSNVSIQNSSSTLNPFDGIYLKDSPGTTISHTILNSNEVAGIAILSDDTVMHSNQISSNKAAGILIYGNDTILTDNRITGNSGRGILIDAVSGGIAWNNLIINTRNLEMSVNPEQMSWNVSPRVYPAMTGKNLSGGNYWGNPDEKGFSDTCESDEDGFCTLPAELPGGATDFHPLTKNISSSQESGKTESLQPDGDLNHNGREDMNDVVLLMEWVSDSRAGPECDFSQDGNVNLHDVVTLFMRISG